MTTVSRSTMLRRSVLQILVKRKLAKFW